MHYQLNGGATQSLRMTYNSATGRHEQNVLTPVAAGNTLSYRFTYDKDAPAYDTPSFAYTVGSTGGGTVATPTFSPAPGTYTGTQSVAHRHRHGRRDRSATRTDGSTPTAASALYGGPISGATSRTIKAHRRRRGMTNSAVATGAYTINTSGGFTFTHGVDAGRHHRDDLVPAEPDDRLRRRALPGQRRRAAELPHDAGRRRATSRP